MTLSQYSFLPHLETSLLVFDIDRKQSIRKHEASESTFLRKEASDSHCLLNFLLLAYRSALGLSVR